MPAGGRDIILILNVAALSSYCTHVGPRMDSGGMYCWGNLGKTPSQDHERESRDCQKCDLVPQGIYCLAFTWGKSSAISFWFCPHIEAC